jgi:hypothetical protein
MARRRRLGMGFQQVSLPGGRRGLRNWIVGSTSFDSTGAVHASPVRSWFPAGGLANSNVTANGSCTLALAMVQPVAGSTTPTVGAMRVDAVKGTISFFAGTASAFPFIPAIGLYVAQLNVSASKWSVRSLSDALETQRDDFLYLWGGMYRDGPVTTNFTGSALVVDIDVKIPVVIGGGEALVLTVTNGGADTLAFNPAIRSLVGPVA